MHRQTPDFLFKTFTKLLSDRTSMPYWLSFPMNPVSSLMVPGCTGSVTSGRPVPTAGWGCESQPCAHALHILLMQARLRLQRWRSWRELQLFSLKTKKRNKSLVWRSSMFGSQPKFEERKGGLKQHISIRTASRDIRGKGQPPSG